MLASFKLHSKKSVTLSVFPPTLKITKGTQIIERRIKNMKVRGRKKLRGDSDESDESNETHEVNKEKLSKHLTSSEESDESDSSEESD